MESDSQMYLVLSFIIALDAYIDYTGIILCIVLLIWAHKYEKQLQSKHIAGMVFVTLCSVCHVRHLPILFFTVIFTSLNGLFIKNEISLVTVFIISNFISIPPHILEFMLILLQVSLYYYDWTKSHNALTDIKIEFIIDKKEKIENDNDFFNINRPSSHSGKMKLNSSDMLPKINTPSAKRALKDNSSVDLPYYFSIEPKNALSDSNVLNLIDSSIIIVNSRKCLVFANPNGLRTVNLFSSLLEMLTDLKSIETKRTLEEEISSILKEEFAETKTIKFNKVTSQKLVIQADPTTKYIVRMQHLRIQHYVLLNIVTKPIKGIVGSTYMCETLKDLVSCSLFNDLSNIVNVINGNIEMIEQFVPLRMKSHYNTAMLFAKILNYKLRDIDDFSKINNNKFKLHINQFYLIDAFNEINSVIGAFAQTKQIGFSIDLTSVAHKSILSDKERLLQVLMISCFTIIESIRFGSVSVKTLFPNHGRFEILINIKTQEKQKIDMLFKFRQSDHSINSPLDSYDGVSLISTSYIAKRIGKGIKCEHLNNEYIVTITINDGFNLHPTNEIKIRRMSHIDKHMAEKKKDSLLNSSKSHGRKIEQKRVKEKKAFEYLCTLTPHKPTYHFKSSCKTDRLLEEFDRLIVAEENHSIYLTDKYIIHRSLKPGFVCKSSKLLGKKKSKRRPTALPDDNDKYGVQYTSIIAEDNSMNQMVLKNLLKLYKINSIIVKDGSECLQLIHALIERKEICQLKLIFMDMQMPVMDGIEATIRILKLMKEKHVNIVPIIGVSADNSDKDRRNFINAGICEFVSKPITKYMLGVILMKYLRL